MKKKIIIDTDPGQDDAVAIMLALASHELEVVGLTVVAGNVPLDLTCRNARMICDLAGKPEQKFTPALKSHLMARKLLPNTRMGIVVSME